MPRLTPCASSLLFSPLNSVTTFHLRWSDPVLQTQAIKSQGHCRVRFPPPLFPHTQPLPLVYTFFYTSHLSFMSSFIFLMPWIAAVVECYAAFRCGLCPAWKIFEPAAISRLWLCLASKNRPANGNCHLLCYALLLLLLPLLLHCHPLQGRYATTSWLLLGLAGFYS